MALPCAAKYIVTFSKPHIKSTIGAICIIRCGGYFCPHINQPFMKTKLLASLLLFPFLSFAQHTENSDPFAQTQLTLDVGFTGIQGAAEMAVGNKSTVQFRGGVAPVVYNPSKYTGTEPYGAMDMKWVTTLAFSAEYRHYYNVAKRLEKEKDITNNGANYVGFLTMYLTKPLGKNKDLTYATSALLAGPVWGFNRPLGSRALFHLDLGPVLQHEITAKNTGMTIWADARFCIKLN